MFTVFSAPVDEGEEEEAVPSAPIEINAAFVTDDNHPDVRKAVWNDGTLTFYLPVGWKVAEVNESAVATGLVNGVTVFNVSQVALIEADPSIQRTCKYFTANDVEFVDGDAEVAKDFRFHKPLSQCSCSHPDVVRRAGDVNARCDHAASQINCNIYEAQEWQVVRIARGKNVDNEDVEVALHKNRQGFGVPVFRSTVNGEHDANLGEASLFDGVLNQYSEVEEGQVDALVAVKNSFLASIVGDPPDEQ